MENRNSLIGKRIRDLRLKLNLTQSELADNSFTKSFISQVEKGLTTPSIKSLAIIAERLGVPVSYFLSDEALSHHDGTEQYLIHLETARRLHTEKRFVDAVRQYKATLSHVPPTYHDLIAGVHLALAEIYSDQSRFHDAMNEVETAIEHLKLSKNNFTLARAYNILGHLQTELKDFVGACSSFRAGISALNSDHPGDISLLVRLLVNLGISYSHSQEFHRSIETLARAVELMRETDEFYNFGKACHTLGYAYAKLGDYENAIAYTTRALELYLAIGHVDLAMNARINLAIFLRLAGNHEEAHRHLRFTLEECKSDGLRARAHAELAHLAVTEGDYDEAIENVKRAFELSPAHAEIPEWLEILVRVGEARPLPREWVDQLAQHISRWRADDRALAEAHSSLGALYRLLGDTEKANHHLSQSVALFKKAQG